MTQQTQTLDGKVAVITGAGRGIGKAIALAYSQAGAKVGCLARTAREIEATVQEIEEKEGQAIAIQTDVTDIFWLFDPLCIAKNHITILLRAIPSLKRIDRTRNQFIDANIIGQQFFS